MDGTILDELKDLTGYMGSAITDARGNVLISHVGQKSTLKEDDYNAVLGIINKTFVDNHQVTKALGIGGTKEMSIATDNAIILFACTGEDNSHRHVFVALDKEGSDAFAKMIVQRIIRKVA